VHKPHKLHGMPQGAQGQQSFKFPSAASYMKEVTTMVGCTAALDTASHTDRGLT